MAKIILVVGLTGAGKTTYCDQIAQKEHGIVYSIDRLMKTLYWPDMPENPDMKWFEENSNWYVSRILRCESYITNEIKALGTRNFNIILDLGFTSEEHRTKYLHFGKSYSLESEIHFLDLPREERWKRVSKRNEAKGTTFTMNVTREMFDYIENIFEPISETEMRLCTKFLKY
jgi:predicted kinase